MNELMTALQHISPALAVGAASLGAAIWATARDRIAAGVVTRGHAFLDHALVGDENDDCGEVIPQLSDDERELVDAVAGRSANVVLAVGDGSVALDKLTVHGGNVTVGGAGAAGPDSP